jgi:hypothetical protein
MHGTAHQLLTYGSQEWQFALKEGAGEVGLGTRSHSDPAGTATFY